jgi:hypothetical protein
VLILRDPPELEPRLGGTHFLDAEICSPPRAGIIIESLDGEL